MKRTKRKTAGAVGSFLLLVALVAVLGQNSTGWVLLVIGSFLVTYSLYTRRVPHLKP